MNLVYADIVEIFPNGQADKIRIGGALKEISFQLLEKPATGERVLVCEGIALGKVGPSIPKEIDYVSGHTW